MVGGLQRGVVDLGGKQPLALAVPPDSHPMHDGALGLEIKWPCTGRREAVPVEPLLPYPTSLYTVHSTGRAPLVGFHSNTCRTSLRCN